MIACPPKNSLVMFSHKWYRKDPRNLGVIPNAQLPLWRGIRKFCLKEFLIKNGTRERDGSTKWRRHFARGSHPSTLRD